MTVNLLAKIPLFSDLPGEELDYLSRTLQVSELDDGQVLFREGDAGEHLYLVLDGELEVLMAEGTQDEIQLNVLGKGEYIGEMSLLLPGGERTATARARGNVVLLGMSRSEFMELLRRQPSLAYSMVRVLSERLDAANAATFRDLTEKNRQLQQAYNELKAAQEQIIEKERLERELQVAAEIQFSILPDQLPETPQFDFGACILPARQVGGDFYDVFQIEENKIGVLIGDVADKGVPSALFMARTHALIMAEADTGISPGEVMKLVNGHITRLEKSTQFVTALYGVLHCQTGEFSYARAGHEPPLLLTADGQVERLPYQTGMSLGLWDTITIDEHTLILPAGATLLLFTDGLTDCREPAGECFGLERIKQHLRQVSGQPAQQVCAFLLETLQQFQQGARQDDDVTLVAVHRAMPA
jgi:serine phosphatase RsbU (regulator of sigma subunit)